MDATVSTSLVSEATCHSENGSHTLSLGLHDDKLQASHKQQNIPHQYYQKGKLTSLDYNLQSTHIDTGFKHSLLGMGMVVHTFNPCTQEAETAGPS